MVVEHLIDNNRIFIDLPKCQAVLLISLFIYFYPNPRTFSSLQFRERGREGETLMQERSTDWLPPIRLDRGLNLQPRYVPWSETEPSTFWLGDNAPTTGPHWPGPVVILNVILTLVILRNFEGSSTRLFLAPCTVFHPPSSILCTPAERRERVSLSSVLHQFDSDRGSNSVTSLAPIKTKEKEKRNG